MVNTLRAPSARSRWAPLLLAVDQREAPQRAIAKQKKDAEDARLSDEQTRATDKAAFRP
jgi:hypothetical protein